MGACASAESAEEKQAAAESLRFDAVLATKKEHDEKVIKLLLLGTGESGKSTVFKQMQILYGEEFSDYERATYRSVVRRNLLESVQVLVAGCDRFAVPFRHPNSVASAKWVVGVDTTGGGAAGAVEFWTDELVPHIKHLWTAEPAIRELYAKQRSQLQLMDSAAYFLDAVDRIGAANYVASRDDILRARLRTSGIVERTFRIGAVDFKFVDVGGQRNERRKWMHCFEGVTAVMFVAAISEYDQQLYEDEKENRMHETLKVFENIINTPVFRHSTIILFLNKTDLFEDKLVRQKSPLRACFPEYTGADTLADAQPFLESQFVACSASSKRMLFPHFTCATDTTQVSKVFEACKQTILSENLKKLGLDS